MAIDAEWLAENYTALELTELLMLALKERDAARDLLPDDGLCAGGYENGPVGQEKWSEYPEAGERRKSKNGGGATC